MKLKRFALRGLAAVAIGAALCMFFSGTIESITTPKVKLIKAARGKLTQEIRLSAALAYPETEGLRPSLPAGQTATITRVNVRPGYAVKAGDVVLEAQISGYDAAMEAARDAYDAALDEYMELRRKGGGISLRQSEQAYADSYAALREAIRESAEAGAAMQLLLDAEGLAYPESGYPAGASGELAHRIDLYRASLAAVESAQAAFDLAARRGIDEDAWSYIRQSQAAREKMDGCASAIAAMEEAAQALSAIRAPHDGYISEIAMQPGSVYDGSADLFRITAEDSAPVLRADLGDVQQNISEGMKVSFPSARSGELSTQVCGIGYNESGEKYADIAVTDEMISASGSLYSLSQNSVEVKLSFKAANSSCLLPSAAVRGSGENRYVYTVSESSTAFGKLKKSISKLKVTVLAEADGTASIQEDVSYYSIAYMEDRALSDGSAVMEYPN